MRPLVLLGPSGSGKSTFIKKLFADYPDKFGFSISHTTRKPRKGEEDNVHYHFVDRAQFDQLILENAFIEHAVFASNCYGTSFQAVQDISSKGKICVLDIDSQGVDQLEKTDLNPVLIFLKVPTLEILERRLKARGTDDDSVIASRVEIAKKELEWAKSKTFDGTIINDELEVAYKQLLAVLHGKYPELK